ncbi:MAG: sigma-70 family RNA polymerase sigma factor [Clostridia bacterium]|nr:sigma-70 family RNA polymerase sigma factor [Clostridia bacterium]
MNKNEIGKLITKVSEGDNNAFLTLYKATVRGVYAYLYTYFKNSADTQDATQTVYLKVKTKSNQFKYGTNGLAWLLQIAKNHAIDVLRKQDKTVPLENAYGVCANQVCEHKNSVTEVMQKVLSEDEQRIVVMHVLWGYKHKEIALLNKTPLGTVTSKYKRAIAKLKNALKEERQ